MMIGDKIRQLRQENHMTQENLARFPWAEFFNTLP